jgi:UDP-N-acetylmuramoyl-tripeptide--D-alanyl-D-alanine ligase
VKEAFKNLVAAVLGWQVKRLRARHEMKVVAVTGSVGKTGSKLAIATVLSQKYKVRHQFGNYNHLVTVPLVFFGDSTPNILNPFAWFWIFAKNEVRIRKRYPYEVVVLELGTDGPGQIEMFKRYLKVDIGVLTAITPEHMQFFSDMDAVAKEELAIADLCEKFLANADMAGKYLKIAQKKALTYGINEPSDYRLSDIKFDNTLANFSFYADKKLITKSSHSQTTEPQLYSLCAAAAVGQMMGLTPEQIDNGIKNIEPVSGRMQFLKGQKDSTIIDDTYNSSPEANRAALSTLYRLKAPKKIAVLGNMNELGHFSKAEHEAVGSFCDPKKIDALITIGPDANQYLAKAAEARGVKVTSFSDPYSAGKFVSTLLAPGTIVLVKGSQNKVFAEETVKLLLQDPSDSAKLVRQSPQWLKLKRRAFSVKM